MLSFLQRLLLNPKRSKTISIANTGTDIQFEGTTVEFATPSPSPSPSPPPPPIHFPLVFDPPEPIRERSPPPSPNPFSLLCGVPMLPQMAKIYAPNGKWAWAAGFSMKNSKVLQHAGNVTVKIGTLGHQDVLYMEEEKATLAQIAIYKRELKPLLGMVVPDIINIYTYTGGRLGIAFDIPHIAGWAEASDKMPNLLKQRCIDAVGLVHARGILHGNLQLSNILIGANGQINIINFRSARSVTPFKELGLLSATEEEIDMEMRVLMFRLGCHDARTNEQIIEESCPGRKDCIPRKEWDSPEFKASIFTISKDVIKAMRRPYHSPGDFPASLLLGGAAEAPAMVTEAPVVVLAETSDTAPRGQTDDASTTVNPLKRRLSDVESNSGDSKRARLGLSLSSEDAANITTSIDSPSESSPLKRKSPDTDSECSLPKRQCPNPNPRALQMMKSALFSLRSSPKPIPRQTWRDLWMPHNAASNRALDINLDDPELEALTEENTFANTGYTARRLDALDDNNDTVDLEMEQDDIFGLWKDLRADNEAECLLRGLPHARIMYAFGDDNRVVQATKYQKRTIQRGRLQAAANKVRETERRNNGQFDYYPYPHNWMSIAREQKKQNSKKDAWEAFFEHRVAQDDIPEGPRLFKLSQMKKPEQGDAPTVAASEPRRGILKSSGGSTKTKTDRQTVFVVDDTEEEDEKARRRRAELEYCFPPS